MTDDGIWMAQPRRTWRIPFEKMGVYCYGVVDEVWSTSGSTWGHVASLKECENPESVSKQHTKLYK